MMMIIITTNNRTIKKLINSAAAAIINKSLRDEDKIKEDVSIDLSNQLLVISKWKNTTFRKKINNILYNGFLNSAF